jgi:hypothetical protein
MSPAGTNLGLRGERSGLFWKVTAIIAYLQSKCVMGRVGYLLENIGMQYNHRSDTVRQDYQVINKVIGKPVSFDAARFGSYAHRFRNYWSNLCATHTTQAVIDSVQRPPNRFVNQVLDQGTEAQSPTCHVRNPYYPCDIPGECRQALPTVMSYKGSYAYRPGQAGSLIDRSVDPPIFREPNAQERERIMGFEQDSTDAQGVSEDDRCAAIGSAIDLRALRSLLSIATQLQKYLSASLFVADVPELGGKEIDLQPDQPDLGADLPDQLEDNGLTNEDVRQFNLVCLVTEIEEQTQNNNSEIWADQATLRFLKWGEAPAIGIRADGSSNRDEYLRVIKRAARFALEGEELIRILPNGSRRCVPKPELRSELIKVAHEKT